MLRLVINFGITRGIRIMTGLVEIPIILVGVGGKDTTIQQTLIY